MEGAIMTSVLLSWEIFKSLVMTSVQWSESPDSMLSPDWSINGTPGPLIGCYCAQTDLIKSSSDDTFRVSRCKTQDDLLWRKSPNHLMVKPALVVILNLNIYPLSWHKAGNPHYIYNYTMIHSVRRGSVRRTPHTVIRSKPWSGPDWVPASLSSFTGPDNWN